MIGIDTNILVRLFANDDRVQVEKASRLIDELPDQRSAVVNLAVVLELLWTLRRAYASEPDDLAMVIARLSEHPKLMLPDRDVLREAAHRLREEGGDIADHINAVLNRSLGCETTFTFDVEAAGGSDLTLLR